jgi:hypothetical protein
MFCPVLIWASIVQRVRSYPGTNGKLQSAPILKKESSKNSLAI